MSTIKRDEFGRVIPFCGRHEPAVEMTHLMPEDRKWDMWVCPRCRQICAAFMYRSELEEHARERERPGRPKTAEERIAELEAEVARMKANRS